MAQLIKQAEENFKTDTTRHSSDEDLRSEYRQCNLVLYRS